MKIYTRKNALVGYLVLRAKRRAIEKRLARGRRSGLKVAAYVGLGLVSAGILAGVLAIALRRRQAELAETDNFDADDDTEIVGEYVTAPKAIPAT